MFDKWLNEEIAIPLQKRKRVVIADESNHHELWAAEGVTKGQRDGVTAGLSD